MVENQKEAIEKLAVSNRRLFSRSPDKETEYEYQFHEILKDIEERDRKTGNFPYDSHVQTIRDFYAGKDILVTGGTGFVGKVLVEKILRSCPEGGKIFILLRGRKGVSPQERIKAMLKLPLFGPLLATNPRAAERVVPIEGDTSILGLGLSQADRQMLIENVSIVFHCAATVRFNLPLHHIILVNVRGTREVVYLCKELKSLSVFVFVSTAFCTATTDRTTVIREETIPEEVIPAIADWRAIIASAEKSARNMGTDGFNLIFEKMDTKQPNNYTFTKSLSENLVEDECAGIPAIIVRPAVVIASYEDPFEGWIDNLYGPMSIWDGIGHGVVRAHYGSQTASLNYVPVDFTVKILMTAAWHRGIGFRMSSEPDKIDVINNTASEKVTLTNRMLDQEKMYIYYRATRKFNLRYPRFHQTNRFWLFWLITITSQVTFGYLVDTLLKMKGKEPILLPVYRRLYFAQTFFLFHFCDNVFKFDHEGQFILNSRMPKEDQPMFSTKTKMYRFDYSVDNVAGIIKYIFKQEVVTVERSNIRLLLVLDWVHNFILAATGLWILSWFIR